MRDSCKWCMIARANGGKQCRICWRKQNKNSSKKSK